MRCVMNAFRKRNWFPEQAFGASYRVYFDTPPPERVLPRNFGS